MTATIETPPPRLIANAIADLGAGRVREAWRYLDAWDALVAAGVPKSTIRECLAEPVETQPLAEVDAWVRLGERGLLALVGDPGTGKTYAQARWVLSRHRRGLFTTWTSAPALALLGLRERDAELGRLATVGALVIDDVGAGASGADFLREQLCGLIQIRIDELRPTGLGSNATRQQLEAWLGPRIVDRCKVAGGVEQVTSKDSLRAWSDADVDAAGRGPEWREAKRIVELVGCEPRQRYGDDGEALPLDLDVGANLDRAARREGYDACKRARLALGLLAADVEERARALGEAEANAVEWMAGTLGVQTMAASISFEGVAAAIAEKRRAMEAQRRAADEDTVANILDRARARLSAAANNDGRDLGAYENATVPAWAEGKEGRRKLYERGFRVRSRLDGFELSREADKRTSVLVVRCASEAEAWMIAGLLCAEIDTRPGGDAIAGNQANRKAS